MILIPDAVAVFIITNSWGKIHFELLLPRQGGTYLKHVVTFFLRAVMEPSLLSPHSRCGVLSFSSTADQAVCLQGPWARSETGQSSEAERALESHTQCGS